MKKIAKILATILAIIALTAMADSCKKDDATETEYLSFEGNFTFALPTFLAQDTDYIISPTDIRRSKKDTSSKTGYGIGVTISSKNLTDTLRKDYTTTKVSYTVHTPKDTLGAFVVMMYAFSSGYTTLYAEKDCHIVDPDLNTGSLTDFSAEIDDPYIIDGGRKYYITKNEDGPVFMRQNYAGSEDGAPYYNCPVMTDVFGKYYTWEDARDACPDGWHVATKDEFYAFCLKHGLSSSIDVDDTYTGIAGKLMADAYFNGEKLWEYWPEVRISDDSYFSALPTGYAQILEDNNEMKFYGANEYFCFWVEDPDEDPENGVYRYINLKYNNVYRGVANSDNFCASVRCVKD